MEKKTSPTQLAFSGSVTLYRDDLDDIVKRLTETSEKVIIEDNEYRYNSLDEVLEKQGPYPKQLSINSREPLVILNVGIRRAWTTLGTSGDGDNLAPYFFIKQILESRKRKGLRFLLTGPPVTLRLCARIFANRLCERHSKFKLQDAVKEYEAHFIEQALEESKGSVTRAAKKLGITHQGLAFILTSRQKKFFNKRIPPRTRRKSLMKKDI